MVRTAKNASLRTGVPSRHGGTFSIPGADVRQRGSSTTQLLALQRLAGNAAVVQLLDHGLSPGQAASPMNGLHAQRKTKRSEASTAREETKRPSLEDHLRSEMQRGGITVAVYVSPLRKRWQTTGTGKNKKRKLIETEVSGASEFQGQAQQFAEDHGAIGIASGTPEVGKAMELTDDVPSMLGSLQKDLQGTLEPAPAGETSGEQIPIRRLAIFTHGERDQIEAAPEGNWIKTSLVPWVAGMAPYLSASPSVLLYACSTAGAPAKGIPFAEAVQQALQADLDEIHGESSPQVWGHKVAGHTTTNRFLKSFGSGGSGDLIEDSGWHLARLAATQAGVVERLGSRDVTALVRKATAAAGKIFSVAGKDRGRTNPQQVVMREVPMIGIPRLWEFLGGAVQPTPQEFDMSTASAQRMIAGLVIFREKLGPHLKGLQLLATKLGSA